MNRLGREQIFSRLQALNPNPTTELEYRTPFELLAAVLLSAQATDISVNAATRKLFAVANTPQGLCRLGVAGVEPYIRTIGLFRTKARHLIATCEILIRDHGGEVPEDRDALEALPGVGRKTANVVLNTAFGWETIAVDTHIFRVSNRTGLAHGKTVSEVEKRLEARELIHALLDLCERADAACVVVLSPTAVIGPLASQLVQRVKLVEMRAVGFSGPGDPMETIVPFMRDLLTRRVGPWPPPMDSIVGYAARSSGGLPRVFLQLMSDTLAYAKLRGHEWPTTEDLAEAVADHQDSLRYLLDKGDVEVLAAAAAGSRDVDAGTLARLVANGYLLSGGRGHSQAYYVHPLVRALLPP